MEGLFKLFTERESILCSHKTAGFSNPASTGARAFDFISVICLRLTHRGTVLKRGIYFVI